MGFRTVKIHVPQDSIAPVRTDVVMQLWNNDLAREKLAYTHVHGGNLVIAQIGVLGMPYRRNTVIIGVWPYPVAAKAGHGHGYRCPIFHNCLNDFQLILWVT